ncbi:MAG: glycoside hydrolase family 130 protein [Acidobacteriaceae bacterium]
MGPIRGQLVHWEALHTFNPAAIVRNGKIDLLYRAEDNTEERMEIGMHTSRLGLAESKDGIHFTPRGTPVFYPAKDAQQSREWPGGVEDPRIVESEGGTYVLTYTQWNRKTYTVGVATSKDLRHWTKYGPAFAGADGGKYDQLEYKSAGILTHLVGDRLLAAKLHGKYWMYWGEIQIRLATSPDLIHWTPVEDSQGKPLVLLTRRPGLFDSAFPEMGPPPILMSQGILLFYNGKNADHGGALGIGAGAYSGGQALFSANDPARLLKRANQPYIQPKLSWEKSGQYTAGTTFTEGLVFFHGKWFLYYGAADSYVGVAECNPSHGSVRAGAKANSTSNSEFENGPRKTGRLYLQEDEHSQVKRLIANLSTNLEKLRSITDQR